MQSHHRVASALCIAAQFLQNRERLGSGDGERKTLLTRQIAFEPLPASVLLGLFDCMVDCTVNRLNIKSPTRPSRWMIRVTKNYLSALNCTELRTLGRI